MFRRFAAAILSALLLSPGWLSLTGLTLPVALVPLLWISASRDSSRRAWWGMFGWAALTFAAWNAMTVWWIWNATPVGPVAATLASTTLNMLAFMLFHTVSKKAPKALAYTLLAAGWITTEYWYTVGAFSWPWLILGNGFSHDVWAVQWYEYTGVFGGSLWVLLCNILLFEAWQARRSVRKWAAAACTVVLPMLLSLGIWRAEGSFADGGRSPLERRPEVVVSVIQPDVDCYDKFHGDTQWQERNILELLDEVPADAQFVLLPETAVPGHYRESDLAGIAEIAGSADPSGLGNETQEGPSPSDAVRFWRLLAERLRTRCPGALLVTGANTRLDYPSGPETETARWSGGRSYYDIFNSAVGLDSAGRTQIHHKGRLVIGVENTPTWVFDVLQFLVIDLGGTYGQIGKGRCATAFGHEGVTMGPAICYEGLYGDFFGDFVRRGAQFMAILSNDGWWGDTPGYEHLFTISRLRAIEHRRAVVRSANTGRSGFISARGDVGETLGWEQRGVITAQVPLASGLTFYTRYGDYLGRIAEYLSLLCVLYYAAYRVKRRNYLIP